MANLISFVDICVHLRKDQSMNVETVKDAIERGGSVRAAAVLLGKSYTSVQWWLARNGYRVEKVAKLVKADQAQGSK